MNKQLKSGLFYLLTVGAAAFLLWFSFKDMETMEDPNNPEKMMPLLDYFIFQAKQANPIYLILSAVIALLSHLVRAKRWEVIMEPIGYKPSLKNSFLSVMVGYFVNLLIPRGGEVSRSVTMNKLQKEIPVDTALGTIVAERIIDLIFLVSCIGVTFLVEFDKLSTFDFKGNGEAPAGSKNWVFITLAILALIFTIIFIVIKKNKTLYDSIAVKIKSFLYGLKKGFSAVLKIKKRMAFIAYSLLIWVCYYFMFYTIFLAFPATESLGTLAALTMFTIGGIAMAIPLPGGTGSFHALVPPALMQFYAVAPNEAKSCATIFHAWQTLVIITSGAICLLISKKIASKNAKITK